MLEYRPMLEDLTDLVTFDLAIRSDETVPFQPNLKGYEIDPGSPYSTEIN